MTFFKKIKNTALKIKNLSIGPKILHNGFEIGILLKGFDGILEIAGGIVLMFVSPERLNRIIFILTQHELSRDPNDFLANVILRLSQGFSVSTQHFGVFYLLTHGVVKIILFFMLWGKILWAYPMSIGFFILFIIYQIHRYVYSHSIWMIFLTVFDLIVILLVWIEYGRIREKSG